MAHLQPALFARSCTALLTLALLAPALPVRAGSAPPPPVPPPAPAIVGAGGGTGGGGGIEAAAWQLFDEAIVAQDEAGDEALAAAKLQEALPLFQQLGEREQVATILKTLVAYALHAGDDALAFDYLEELMKIRLGVEEVEGNPQALAAMAGLLEATEFYVQAVEIYGRAGDAAIALGDSIYAAQAYREMARVQSELGALRAALENNRRALDLFTAAGQPLDAAVMHLRVGSGYILLEELPQAVPHLAEAVRLFRTGGDEFQELLAQSLEALGAAYTRAGDARAAQEVFVETAELYTALGDDDGVANIYVQLGRLRAEMADYAFARETFDRARALHTTNNDDQGLLDVIYWQARAYGFEGLDLLSSDVEQAQERFRRAIAEIEQGLAHIETMDPPDLWGKGFLLEELARQLGFLDDPSETARLLPRLESEIATLTDPGTRGPTLSALGLLYARLERFEEARTHYEQAIAIFLESDDPGSASSTYTELGLSFILEGDWVSAVVPLERGLELASSLSRPRARPGDASYLIDTRITDNYQLLTAVYVQVGRMEDAFNSAEEGRARPLTNETAHFDVELTSPTAPPALKLDEVQALLGPDETLVTFSYSLNILGLLAFVVTADSLDWVRLETDVAAIDALLLRVRARPDTDTTSTSLAALAELHTVLLAPIRNLVTKPRLLIVPTGNLYGVPFPALRAPDGRFLGEEHEIALLPSASALDYLPDNAARLAEGGPTTALVLAQHQAPGWPRLDDADDEAAAVARLLGSQPWVGEAATETLLRAEAGSHDILHIAAHGEYNAQEPLASRLILGADAQNDGLIEARDLYSLDLSNVRLVTLSACETAVGEVGAGDEVASLTRALLYARAPAIVSSLWQVNDEATRRLMEAFYGHLLEGKGTAAALQQAQADLRARPEYAHPYYWAAFVLTGDADPVLPE